MRGWFESRLAALKKIDVSPSSHWFNRARRLGVGVPTPGTKGFSAGEARGFATSSECQNEFRSMTPARCTKVE